MAAQKLCAVTILIFSLVLVATFTGTSCGTCEPKPKTKPKPHPTPKQPPANPFCPRDTLKLGACADLLGLVNLVAGTPPSSKCCAVLEGLADLEAAVCLCTAIKANILGINIDIPIALSTLVTACGKSIPTGFKCG